MNPMRRIVVAWARVQNYADGTAMAEVVQLTPGQRVLVVQAEIAGHKASATFRYRGDPDLHKVAAWAEHLEETASRVAIKNLHRFLQKTSDASTVVTPPKVLH